MTTEEENIESIIEKEDRLDSKVTNIPEQTEYDILAAQTHQQTQQSQNDPEGDLYITRTIKKINKYEI